MNARSVTLRVQAVGGDGPAITTAARILDRAAVAALLGVDTATVSTYKSRYAATHPTPPAAGRHGGSDYWTDPQAWLDWDDGRPGRTGRPRKDPG